MTGRFAVFIDAGWLLALAAETVAARLPAEVECDHARLLAGIADLAAGHAGGRLLRQYWYETRLPASSAAEQEAIGRLPNVKVRLAGSGPADRHGVGTLMTLDLLRLAARRVIGSAFVLAGDGDLAESVAEAQGQGMNVTVGRIETPPGRCGQSKRLLRECDDQMLIATDLLRRSLRPRLFPEPGGSVAGM